MPTYTYACDACSHEFEREQRISEDPIKKCPKCGKNKARRTITQGNFILKGSGWYADGYGSAGSASTASSAKSISDTTSTTSSDTASTANSDTTASTTKSDKAKPSKPAGSKTGASAA